MQSGDPAFSLPRDMANLSRQWFHTAASPLTAQLRLFCFPYGGAGHSVFLEWPRHLPPQVEVCMASLPGRGGRFLESAHEHVEDVVEALLEAMTPLLDLPFVLFGHSVGALIAFELARALERRGAPQPRRLIASGRVAPQIPYSGPLLHRLDDESLKRELRRIGGTPESVLGNEEMFRAFAPMLRADFAVTETYRYEAGRRLSCAIDAFGGRQDEQVPIDDLDAWRGQTSQAFEMHLFDGGHFFVNTCRAHVVTTLAGLLEQVAPVRAS